MANPQASRVSAASAPAEVLQAMAALLSHATLDHAAVAFALDLRERLGCERVSVGLVHAGAVAVVGTSDAQELDERLGLAGALAAAMDEAVDQDRAIAVPPVGDGPPSITLAHQLLAHRGGANGCACSVVVRDAQRAVGALTLERSSGAFSVEELTLAADIAAFAGPVLDLMRRQELPWWRRAQERARQWLAAQDRRRLAIYGGVAAVLLAILLLPVSWRVSAPARLEGSVQRAIVASTDGFVQQANVRAGDVVRQGQVLIELAQQDLELERRRRESELRQHENAYRAAQARNDRTQMVISQARAAEAQAMLSLAQGQVDRARIAAPFDGVVIKGDLSQTLGAPVQRGEVLMTMAPNESFRLIVEVDENDIAAVQPGQPGRLVLTAQPDRQIAFQVQRVVPVSVALDGRNYFEVEARLDDPGAGLRPGLGGVAKIEAGSRRIGWILTHRFTDWLALSAWSLGW